MEILNIAAIKPNEENPRFITDSKFKKLVKSIKDFPEMLEARPLVIDEDNVVLGGNMRLKALKAAGVFEIPVKRVIGWTEQQKREFIIKDNVSYGEWDWEILANTWNEEQLTDWGMDIPEPEVFEDEDEEIEDDNYQEPDDLQVDVKEGDMIEIGDHKLYCADSTKIENWEKLIGDQEIDLVVTDPPYNVDYEGGTGLKIMNDKMEKDQFYQFLFDFYNATNQKVKQGGAWYVWHASIETVNFSSAMRNSGILLKQYLVWVKNAITLGRQDYQWQHELCLYGWKAGAAHYFTHHRNLTTVIADAQELENMTKDQLLKLTQKIFSTFIPKTIIREKKPSRSAEHPTMKPLPLIGHCIKNSSKKGELVADAFLGSGSTMAAAHELKRVCYGMELDPKYCQVIIDRMLKLDETLEVKINGKPYTKELA